MQNNKHNADACAKAEKFIRSTLRRRRDECANGVPGADPTELIALTHAYWEALSQARDQLLRAVGHRAAAAYRGFKYQSSEDVLHDSLVKACELLVAQYNGEARRFVFDTEDDRSIVGWIVAIIGQGFGKNAGVLGTHLQRERRDAPRFIEASSTEEQTSNGIHEDALLVTDGIDPVRHLEGSEALGILAKRAQELNPKRRFAVELLLLFRVLCEDDDEREFWDQVEKLLVEIWGTDQQRDRSVAVVKTFRQKAPSRLTMDYILEMIETIVGRSKKQLSRWLKVFIKDVQPQCEAACSCLIGAEVDVSKIKPR